ncbi:MAG: hypothetical protein KGJ57_18355 [Sphingomonadales bacterium]|nr:hypothetical protein [Sphingomonadales bacterium]MDE2171362.1 hypothetical protein [Sphingomonadales bacterium]
MSLTVRETSVLERVDAGMSHRAIARELNLSQRYVRTIATSFSQGADQPRLYRKAMTEANEAFIAAIRREMAF